MFTSAANRIICLSLLSDNPNDANIGSQCSQAQPSPSLLMKIHVFWALAYTQFYVRLTQVNMKYSTVQSRTNRASRLFHSGADVNTQLNFQMTRWWWGRSPMGMSQAQAH